MNEQNQQPHNPEQVKPQLSADARKRLGGDALTGEVQVVQPVVELIDAVPGFEASARIEKAEEPRLGGRFNNGIVPAPEVGGRFNNGIVPIPSLDTQADGDAQARRDVSSFEARLGTLPEARTAQINPAHVARLGELPESKN